MDEIFAQQLKEDLDALHESVSYIKSIIEKENYKQVVALKKMENERLKAWVSQRSTAKMLNITNPTLKKLREQGLVKATHVAGIYYYTIKEIERFASTSLGLKYRNRHCKTIECKITR